MILLQRCQLPMKEDLETKYWLDLLKDSDYLDENGYDDIFQDVDEIARMLFSVLKSSGRVRTVSSE